MSLAWSIELDDGKFTKSAERAAHSLVILQGSLAKTHRAFLELEVDGGRALINLTKISDDLGASMTRLAGGALAGLVAGLTLGIHKLDEFGEHAIKAFGERSSQIRAWTVLLESAKDAELEFYKAQQLALKTPFLSSEVEAAKHKLIVSGHRGQELDSGLLGIMDMASIARNKNRALETGTNAYAEVRELSSLQHRQIRMLAQDLGMSVRGLTEQLLAMPQVQELVKTNKGAAKLWPRVAPEEGGTGHEALDYLISKKKISAELGQVAIQRAIMAQLHEGKLGQFATQGASSIQTLLTNKEEGFKNLLKTFDSETLPAVVEYKRALAEAGEALNVNSESGEKLGIVLQDLANSSLGLKTIWQDFSNGFLTSFAESYNAALREMSGTLDDVADGFHEGAIGARELGEAIGKIGGIVAKTVHLLEEMTAGVYELVHSPAARQVYEEERRKERAHEGKEELRYKQEGAGWASVWMDPNSEEAQSMKAQGLLDEESAAKVGRQAGEKMGEEIVAGARAATRTHSPSEEMASFARDLQAGLMQGLQPTAAGGALADQAYGGGVGGGDQYNVYVTAGGDAQDIADQVVQAIREIGRFSKNPGRGLR